jgi:membrane-bound lytic murein transglycosylase D
VHCRVGWIAEEVPDMKWLIGVAIALVISLATEVRAGSSAPSEIPSLLSMLKAPGPVELCGETVPLEAPEVRERFEKEFLLLLWDRPQVILWMKRSRKYFPHIEKVLKERGLPDDLKYVAVIESALRRRVVSSSGAVGFWQFGRDTGKRYGLVINQSIDQRRNFVASTQAAVRFFQDLYGKYRSWTLAVAAYNLGEKRLEAAILEQESKDYYQLYLPGETQRYVFRVLSAKLILSAPDQFGFVLSEEDFYAPTESEEVLVDCPEDVPVKMIAQAARTNFKMIKDLNPEILGDHLPPGGHSILVPKGASEGFVASYKNFLDKSVAAGKDRVYIVKTGDTLTAIAERFGVPVGALIAWNRLDSKRPILAGKRIVVRSNGVTEKTRPETGVCVPDEGVREVSSPSGPSPPQPPLSPAGGGEEKGEGVFVR